MSNIPSQIRMQILHANPDMSRSQADDLIADIPRCYADISFDDCEHHREPQDYYDFSLFDGIALATVFRTSEIEVYVFPADESLIHETSHLAMVDVAEFLLIARRGFSLPETGLRFPISEALPWLESAKSA